MADLTLEQQQAIALASARARASAATPKEPEGNVSVSGIDSLTEKVMGPGPKAEMDLPERLLRVGEAGVAGAGVGGTIGAGVGALGGGVGAVPGAATGAIIGGIGGVLGEIGEQAASAYGAGRTLQTITGLVAGAPAGEIGQLGRRAVDTSLSAIKGLVSPSKTLKIFSDLLNPEQSLATSELRRTATEAAQAPMRAPAATEQVGAGIQEAVAKREQRAAELAARAERGKLGETTALRRQQELADQELTAAKEKGTGPTKSPYDFGTNLKEDIVGASDPLYKQRAAEYKAASDAAFQSASANEAKGQFWAKTPEALDIRKKWKDIAKESSEPIAKEINATLNDIWRKVPIKDETGAIIGYKQAQLGTKGIDQITRRLGEASSKEVEGYKSIGSKLAGELRADLTRGLEKNGERSGGLYDWSGLGPAKQAYKTASEDLAKYESTRGASALETQLGLDLSKTDAEKLPKLFLGSESGFKELNSMLGDPKKVTAYAAQYANNELAGKDVQGIRKWISEHSFLVDNVPEVKDLALNQMNKLSSIENKSLVLKDKLAQAGEKTWSAGVDKFAKRIVSELQLEGPGGLPKDANLIVSDILSGNYTTAQLKAVSKYANDIPTIRSAFPAATADYFSRVSPAKLEEQFRLKRSALEGSGLIDKTELNKLETGIKEIVKASKKIAKPDTSKEVKALFREVFKKAYVPTQLGTEAVVDQFNKEEE